jgi:polyisoprenoid-binding protein YceI
MNRTGAAALHNKAMVFQARLAGGLEWFWMTYFSLRRSKPMRLRFVGITILTVAIVVLNAVSVRAGDEFAIDPVHSSVYFKIAHLDIANVFGRFNQFSGTFTVDDDASKCAFNMSIKTESVDTNNAGRDTHLKSPDFFNAKQFPAIEFKSTAVKAGKGGYEVTGDLTMHGVTKSITFTLTGGKKLELKGKTRTGFSTDLVLKRADFGVGAAGPALGDDVHVAISFEGQKK